jgi:anti-sigma B factor antagonist
MVRPSGFEIHSEFEDDTGRLTVVGELDMATAGELEEALRAPLERSVSRLVIDLSKLSFIDSSGLRLLIVLNDRARTEGWTLGLVRPPEPIYSLFRITGADENLPFLDAPPAP